MWPYLNDSTYLQQISLLCLFLYGPWTMKVGFLNEKKKENISWQVKIIWIQI